MVGACRADLGVHVVEVVMLGWVALGVEARHGAPPVSTHTTISAHTTTATRPMSAAADVAAPG